MSQPAVRLHIDELELHGVDPASRFDVARGLETELSRLFAERGVPPGLHASAPVPGGDEPARPPVVLHGAVAPVDLGRSIARALFAGWQ